MHAIPPETITQHHLIKMTKENRYPITPPPELTDQDENSSSPPFYALELLRPLSDPAPTPDDLVRLILRHGSQLPFFPALSTQKTPLHPAPRLAHKLGRHVLLKREDQHMESFTIEARGVGAWLLHTIQSQEFPATGVVALGHTTQSLTLSLLCSRLGLPCTILLPITDSSLSLGNYHYYYNQKPSTTTTATTTLLSFATPEDLALAVRDLTSKGHVVLPPSSQDVIAGYGTVGMELVQQFPLDQRCVVFCPLVPEHAGGPGFGVCWGIGAYIKRIRPEFRVIGVKSGFLGHNLTSNPTSNWRNEELAGLGVWCDELIEVDAEDVKEAINDVFIDTRALVDDIGALSVAGLLKWTRDNGEAIVEDALIAVVANASIKI